ncbi:MAG: F0F1 ATP synthase subunit A [Methylophilaceae bacterium]|nr:F0F1 ATP synthase subunit A [Methylophilaceae bacterium]
MAIEQATEALTPSEYIAHHLSFNVKQVGDGSFWMLNIDTFIMSVILGVLVMGFIWLVARKATAGVPSKGQAFVELVFSFIDDQVKNIFHGDRHSFIAPTALTVFLWVFAMNAMDFLPVDILAKAMHAIGFEKWRAVPTSDINTTFALALAVWILMIFFAIKVKGLGGWIHELFYSPFGSKFWVLPLNFLFNLIEYVSKPLSHSLRLFGNMYAGEVIFLLLGMWAATGISGTVFGAILGAGWSIFHILIVALQAFIFMMLTVVYLAMAHESH